MSNYYGNYNRKKKGSALQTVVCILLVIILLGVIAGGIFVGVKSEGFKNWDYFKGEQAEQTVPEEGSGVTDGEGNELESGTSYEMPASMVYAVPTAQSTTAASGVTVTATVLPETAINKNVTWSLAFADASASWAQGKTVTDYVTVTADTENSREATVVCKQAFGEQIVLTAASVADPSKTATCTIDYAQSILSYAVKIGDLALNMGSESNISVDIANDDTSNGGMISIECTFSETYTIATEGTMAKSLDFLNYDRLSSVAGEGGYFTFTFGGSMGSHTSYSCDSIEDAEGKMLYFDLRMFDDYNFKVTSGSFVTGEMLEHTAYFKDFSMLLLTEYFDPDNGTYANKVLWTVKLGIETEYQNIEAETDIVFSAIDGQQDVQSIHLDQDSIIFAGS